MPTFVADMGEDEALVAGIRGLAVATGHATAVYIPLPALKLCWPSVSQVLSAGGEKVRE